jgi:hypothetical protein
MSILQNYSLILMKDSLEYYSNCTVINKINPVNLINSIQPNQLIQLPPFIFKTKYLPLPSHERRYFRNYDHY